MAYLGILLIKKKMYDYKIGENVHSDTMGTLNQFPFGKVPLYDPMFAILI
jgi:hypothetical protein